MPTAEYWAAEYDAHRFDDGVHPRGGGPTITELIEGELVALDRVRAALRERSMIYQADLKDTIAAYYHLDRAALYALPYADWAALRDRYHTETARQEATDEH